MDRSADLGTLEPGKLADVLQDITLLKDRQNLLAVLQVGLVKAGRLATDQFAH